MELSNFSSMSLFFLHLLLVLKVLFMFCNLKTPAWLQWLPRPGLRLWSAGNLLILLAKLLLSSLFLKVQRCEKWGCGDPRQEFHKSRESGMPNSVGGKPCWFWGKDACTFPCQILPFIVALCVGKFCTLQSCVQGTWGTKPQCGELPGILVLMISCCHEKQSLFDQFGSTALPRSQANQQNSWGLLEY